MTPWVEQVKREEFTRKAGAAPYNFAPLPEKVVDASQLPDHDAYLEQGKGYSGWFEVKLETYSPVYVRGMLTMPQFLRQEAGQYADTGEPLPEHENPEFRRLAKNVPDFFYTRDPEAPVIPGSSLRGMLRSLLEVVASSKLQPVNDKPKMFFRAVAAPTNDPLKEPYSQALGPNGREVRAGYLIQDAGRWYIWPALTPASLGFRRRGEKSYFQIRDTAALEQIIPDLKHFDATDYRPQYYHVKFQVTHNQRGQPNGVKVLSKNASGSNLHDGLVVCTGNMLETDSSNTQSPRKKFALVLGHDKGEKVQPLTIDPQAVVDYLDSLTPFQKQSPPFDEVMGFLKDKRPVFFVAQGREVRYFGHTPNFRVPALIRNGSRASTPLDFVPEVLRDPAAVDMAEAMFGYVKPKIDKTVQGDKQRAYASRVTVTEAILEDDQADIWLLGNRQEALVPKILATPKATAFQNYLVQSTDDRRQLKHYGSLTPDKTVVRGHKLYWHQGDPTPEQLKPIPGSPSVDDDGTVDERSTQHTQIKPLRSGVKFKFKVHFENLNEVELGALWWALALPVDSPKEYCHSLGMGKPLGMGAVKLTPTLHLINRQERYETLFAEDGWRDGEQAVNFDTDPREKFEQHVLQQTGVTESRIQDTPRIERLLKMMEWKLNPDLSEKQYMSLEDYQQRYVLPDPLDVK